MATVMVFDGSTVQHAAELLFDTAATTYERKLCRHTYLRSLMDFAFGVIFSDTLAAAGKMPPVSGDETPGRDLVEHVKKLPKKVIQIDRPPDHAPYEFLKTISPSERERVKISISHLSEAARQCREFWEHHMVREVRISLGNHPTLSRPLHDAAQYQFEREFFRDSELQALVPAEYISRMQSCVQIPSGVCEEALREFISRNVVAHIVIYHWYQHSARSLQTSSIYLPHATRASLTSARPPDRLWTIRQLMMPHVMSRVLKHSLHRRDVLDGILEEASAGYYVTYRARLAEAIQLMGRGDEQANRLIQDINKTLSRSEETDHVCLGSEAPTDMCYHDSLAFILRESRTGVEEYENQANRLFPELIGIPTKTTTAISAHTVVASVHGIRTRGTWQKELTSELNNAGFKHEPLDYGLFRAIQLLVPSMREKQVKWFREEYTRLRQPGEKVSVIAHSFGTYIVAGALEKYAEVNLENVILCGSIVRRDFPWSEMIPKRVKHVLNDYSRGDMWVRLVEWVIADAGPSGAKGFLDEAGGGVQQHFRPRFQHSDYFYRLNYQRTWIPFLKGEAVTKRADSKSRFLNWKFLATKLVLALAVLSLILWLSLN